MSSPPVNRLTLRLLVSLQAAVFLSLCTGCSDRLRTYPVQGEVRFVSGGPVRVGTVELKSREHGVQARGQIDADGTFTLTTYEPGDGAVAGKHDCVVVQFVMTEGLAGHRPSKLGVIDPRYNSYATSDLEVEIAPDQENRVVLQVDGILKTQPAGDHAH